jgi:hypothetical protein
LLLTLGSPQEKGGKKNPGINPGQRHLNAATGSAIELSHHRQTDERTNAINKIDFIYKMAQLKVLFL